VPPLSDPASRIQGFPRRSMWESTGRAMTTPPRRRQRRKALPSSAKSKDFAWPIRSPQSRPKKSSLEPTLGRTADERRAELQCWRRRCAAAPPPSDELDGGGLARRRHLAGHRHHHGARLRCQTRPCPTAMDAALQARQSPRAQERAQRCHAQREVLVIAR
jgi:hypothetical protein